jgi:hypothetical protein
MDWGVFPHKDEDKGDYAIASWAVEQLKALPKDQPFFLAAGFCAAACAVLRDAAMV